MSLTPKSARSRIEGLPRGGRGRADRVRVPRGGDVPLDGAVLGAGLALLTASLAGPFLGAVLFAVIAVIVAWCGGRRPLLLGATAGALLINLASEELRQGVEVARSVTTTGIVAFALEGLIISRLLTALRDMVGAVAAVRPNDRKLTILANGDQSRVFLESSRRSRERFELLVERIKDYAILMLDADGRIVNWNAGAERILGYRSPEAVGENVSRLYTEADVRDGRPSSNLATAEAMGHHEVEGWRRRKDGTTFWAHVGITALRDEAGDLLGFASITRDLSERKRAEDELRRAHDELEGRVRERTAELAEANQTLGEEIVVRRGAEQALRKQSGVLRSILDNMAEAVIVADEAGRLLLRNPAASRILGVGDRDSGPAGRTFPGDGRAPFGVPGLEGCRAVLERSIRGEVVDDVELYVRRQGTDGGIWVLINGRPLKDEEGVHRGGVIVVRDVTESRRFAEDLRSAKDAAEAANRAKGRFLAVLSHELRTPLAPVLMAAGAALDDGRLAPELRATFEMIRRNIGLEARLIDDLLDFSRAGSGRLSLDPKPLDIHAAIRQSVELCRADILAAGLQLELGLTAIGHHVEADPARVQQILWNLIKNAIKFTPKGGRIAIRTRNREARPDDRATRSFVLEVSDTGIGIAPDSLARIFEPFEQGGPEIRKRFGGLGLGLSISRSLAEAQGGLLTARSAGPGRGATFILEMEGKPERSFATPPAPEAPAGPPAPDVRPLKILLVEDNADTLRYVALVLGMRRHSVRTASDLASAMSLAESHDFDLLVSDIQLPDGSGLDLMRRLRQARGLRGIAMSGFGSDDDIELSKAAGFSEHLTKPVDTRRLDEAILRATGQLAAEDGRPFCPVNPVQEVAMPVFR